MIKTIDPPNERQKLFLTARTRFVAYGGARGGGKSWAVRCKAKLLATRYPGIRILILRRTFPELKENHIMPLLSDLQGVAVYKDSDKVFTFPNKSRIKFGYCDIERDVNQYQGQEYDVIFMDEATHFSEYQFTTLTACLRGVNDFPKRFYVTCNPGGVGHAWVKRLFIDRQYRQDEDERDYTFIPAKVYDNAVLMRKDPGYIRTLRALPETMRRAWLDGDWDVFSGQYFSEFRRDIHVIKPFPVPSHWRRYVALDYGLDMLAALWIAVDEQGRAVVYREYCAGKDGEFFNDASAQIAGTVPLLISQAAQEIKKRMTEPVDAVFAPPDLWNRKQDSGESTAEIFAKNGVYLAKSDNRRAQGWMALHEWLKIGIDERGTPTAALRIFDICRVLIASLPQLQFSERDPNDCAIDPHPITHAPDALRYFIAGRPCPALVEKEDLFADERDDGGESLYNYGLEE